MVLRKELVNRFPDLPANFNLDVAVKSRDGLKSALQKKYGDDTKAKIASLNRLATKVKNGKEKMTVEERVALFQVLADLRINGKKETE